MSTLCNVDSINWVDAHENVRVAKDCRKGLTETYYMTDNMATLMGEVRNKFMPSSRYKVIFDMQNTFSHYTYERRLMHLKCRMYNDTKARNDNACKLHAEQPR